MIGDYIERDPAFRIAIAKDSRPAGRMLPRYEAQGKSYVNVAFGCTGGRHRFSLCR
jgi:UPF0042 nucleotide-binding protein